jgi:hypothetical protein
MMEWLAKFKIKFYPWILSKIFLSILGFCPKRCNFILGFCPKNNDFILGFCPKKVNYILGFCPKILVK